MNVCMYVDKLTVQAVVVDLQFSTDEKLGSERETKV